MKRYHVIPDEYGQESYVSNKEEACEILIGDFGNSLSYWTREEMMSIIVTTQNGYKEFTDEVEICDFIRCGCHSGIKKLEVFDIDGELRAVFTIEELEAA